MWDGYDLNIWIADTEEVERRQRFVQLVRSLSGATGRVTTIRRADDKPQPLGDDPVRTAARVVEDLTSTGPFNVHAEWEFWAPKATWPTELPVTEPPRNDAATRWAELAARESAAILEHVRMSNPVYALYNNPDHPSFMPASRSGDFYVHLGDGVGDVGSYGLWNERADVKEKLAENESRFEAFLNDVITGVGPSHMLMTSYIAADSIEDSLLIYHRDPREFLRDALRQVFLMADELRRIAETPPEQVPQRRVEFFDSAMQEPERLCTEDQLTSLRDNCLANFKASLEKDPDFLRFDNHFGSHWFALLYDAQRLARVINLLPTPRVLRVLQRIPCTLLRESHNGWLLWNYADPFALHEFYQRLVGSIRRFERVTD